MANTEIMGMAMAYKQQFNGDLLNGDLLKSNISISPTSPNHDNQVPNAK